MAEFVGSSVSGAVGSDVIAVGEFVGSSGSGGTGTVVSV